MSEEKPPISHQDSDTSIPTDAPGIELEVPAATDDGDGSKPPDGGYGWVCCASTCAINAFTWGIAGSFGVYLSYYMDHDVFPGATSTDYAFIGGTNFASAMLVSLLLKPVLRALGTNRTMIAGCIVHVAGWIAASFAKTFWQLCLAQGVCIGVGIGTIWLPSIPILPQWFSRKRSLAQGIASCGSGIGGLIFSLATTPMIERLSLAWSLRITGLVCFVVLTCAAALIRDRNAIIAPRSRTFDRQLFKRYQVLMLLGWTVCSILGYIVMLYSLSSYAISIGLTQSQGGVIIALQNVGTALGRPFIGVLSDRYGRMTLAGSVTLFNSLLAFAVWIPATNYGALGFLGVVSGATMGVFWSTIAPLSAEVVGLVDLPSMLSLAWLFVSMPALSFKVSEVIALELRKPDSGHEFLYPQIYTGLAFLVSAAFMLELRRAKWGLWVRERHT